VPSGARSTRTCRYAAASGSRPNSVRARRNHKPRPGRRRSGRSLFGLSIVVSYQAPPDQFLVSPPRLNHCLSITVASPDVISYEFFPVTRAHVLTKAARTTKYIRQLTTTSLFSARLHHKQAGCSFMVMLGPSLGFGSLSLCDRKNSCFQF